MNLSPASLCYFVGSLIYLAIRIHFQRQAKHHAKAEDHSSIADRLLVWMVALAQGGLPWLWLFTALLDPLNWHAPSWLSWLGIAPLVFGLILFWRAHADLGRNWSVTLELAEQHQLVTRGVYAYVRHPMYAAFFALAISQALLISNWLAGPASLVAVSLLYWLRVPNEEQMMLHAFGDQYERYRKTTGAVLPRRRVQA